MSERQYWAKRGRQISGPHASLDAAVVAFRAAYPVKRGLERSRKHAILTGYGNGGPYFDIRWFDAGETTKGTDE